MYIIIRIIYTIKEDEFFVEKNAFEFNSLNRSLTKFFLNIKFQDI